MEANIEFIEVFVNAPLEVCELRDPRGLYRRARNGEIQSFTGIDSPYEAPSSCEFEILTALEAPETSVRRLAELTLLRMSISEPPA